MSAKARARFQQISLGELYSNAIDCYVFVLYIYGKVTYSIVV